VQDTGVGIPADVLSRIFDPFFTTRREQGGSGLGLSTVHGIIRQSGGYLEVVSEEGKGAKFCIYLPRHEAPDVATPKVVPPSLVAPPPAAGRHVLLVEDEDGVRRLAVRALTQRGWTVVSADSGEAALDLFHEDPTLLGMLCAVVSDVVMPGIDGAALVRIIRDLRPDLPAILTSGYAEEAVRSASLIEDVLILSKPYTLKVLQETLEQKALRQPPSMSRSNQPISP
jgi:two-component system cell cycle sensor histidine kinase/response regulator CckA